MWQVCLSVIKSVWVVGWDELISAELDDSIERDRVHPRLDDQLPK